MYYINPFAGRLQNDKSAAYSLETGLGGMGCWRPDQVLIAHKQYKCVVKKKYENSLS